MGVCCQNENSELYSLRRATKFLCKISTFKQLASGFMIRFSNKDRPFYCLMTNEHVINKKMIEQREIINVYFGRSNIHIKIELNPEERFIKNFKDIEIDAIVIEILPSDDVPLDYFLLPNSAYKDKYEELISRNIIIYQFPRGQLKYSIGKIKRLTGVPMHEFAHDASTDKGSSGSPIFYKELKKS